MLFQLKTEHWAPFTANERSSEHISRITRQWLMINAVWSNGSYIVARGEKRPFTQSMTQLTDHEDGERLICHCVTVGDSKGVNPAF